MSTENVPTPEDPAIDRIPTEALPNDDEEFASPPPVVAATAIEAS